MIGGEPGTVLMLWEWKWGESGGGIGGASSWDWEVKESFLEKVTFNQDLVKQAQQLISKVFKK